MNAFRRRFGEMIRENRAAQGLTQGRLASEMKIDQTAMGRIERGQVKVPVELAFRLMARLSIRPDSLLRLGRTERAKEHHETR